MDDYVYVDMPRAEIVPLVPQGAVRVLDVGCAYGGFGATLKEVRPGVEVWGIEPAQRAAGEAAARLDRVIVGHYPQDIPPQEHFDCVVFNDVLEHTLDPWEVLRQTNDILAPAGAVVASIPNVRHWAVVWSLLRAGRWTYRDSGLLDRTHLHFFTRQSMIELFETTGYHVARIEPITFAVRGKMGKIVSLFGHRTEEFRAVQYAVQAFTV
jgi:2-polyprenyl-3-methyl-5-hydroxy-6-metoxy-1,4-benzoquinol methylase